MTVNILSELVIDAGGAASNVMVIQDYIMSLRGSKV
jgi:hypothetical protein